MLFTCGFIQNDFQKLGTKPDHKTEMHFGDVFGFFSAQKNRLNLQARHEASEVYFS